MYASLIARYCIEPAVTGSYTLCPPVVCHCIESDMQN